MFRIPTLISILIAVAALYFAREVFIPLALGLLLTFLLAPLVNRFERLWHIGRIPAVGLVVFIAGGILVGTAWFVTLQFYDLVRELPSYQATIQKKLRSLQVPGGGAFTRAFKSFEQTTRELSTESPATNAPGTAPGPTQQPSNSEVPETKPIPVEIKDPSSPALKLMPSLLGSLLHPVATTGIVIVFVIFMLLHKEDLRNRLLRLVGTGKIHVTTEALNDAAYRVSRFLLMNLMVNVTYGIPIAIGLYFIGVPNAILWGFLATVLRFIPYLGPILGMSVPIALAFAVDPGWTMFLSTVALFTVVELISNNIVEPLLYGSSTGLSPVAVLLGAVFWTWLWGPVGLLMCTPLTVLLVVIGRHFPQLQGFNILLGEEPMLTPAMRFYQRLLARDTEEAGDLAEDILKEKPLIELYEAVILPAIAQAEADSHRGTLRPDAQSYVYQQTRVLVEELHDHVDVVVEDSDQQDTPIVQEVPPAPKPDRLSVLVLPAHAEGDELLAQITAQCLERRGVGAKALANSSLASECIDVLRKHPVPVICICSIPPTGFRQIRYLCKRLRAVTPDLRFVIMVWGMSDEMPDLQGRIGCTGNDLIVSQLEQAVEQINGSVKSNMEPRETRTDPAEEPEPESTPLVTR